MSWKASAWAKSTRGFARNHGAKLLLMVLADYADPETCEAWPTQKHLSDDCCMTPRQVINCLNLLEERGFITRLQKGNQYKPSRYLLHVDAQGYEGAISEGEVIAHTLEGEVSDEVKVKPETSEGEASRNSNLQEPSLREQEEKKDKDEEPPRPEWIEILARDKRWSVKDETQFIKDIETIYGGKLDLPALAMGCHQWLQDSPKGRAKKALGMVWVNWLKGELARNSNGNGPRRPGRVNDIDYAAEQREQKAVLARRSATHGGGD